MMTGPLSRTISHSARLPVRPSLDSGYHWITSLENVLPKPASVIVTLFPRAQCQALSGESQPGQPPRGGESPPRPEARGPRPALTMTAMTHVEGLCLHFDVLMLADWLFLENSGLLLPQLCKCAPFRSWGTRSLLSNVLHVVPVLARRENVLPQKEMCKVMTYPSSILEGARLFAGGREKG